MEKRKIKMFFSGLCIALSITNNAQQVEWVASTSGNYWQKNTKISFEKEPAKKNADIVVSDEKLQQIDGFGGCFNEMGWDALQALAEKDRSQVMNELFSPAGANFIYNRMPIGASDYSLSYYSHNDVANDFGMINFNIDRDRYILIPYIKAAQYINPAVRIWASPWTPPAWMKANEHYAGTAGGKGRDKNGLTLELENTKNATGFKMLKGYLDAYALYFTRFVKAYAAEGIKIDAIHVQNEPCSNQKFPSCKWRAEDLAFFIGEFLGPKFASEGIDTKLFFGTINSGNPDYFRTALNDTTANKYIQGVGFQWSGKKSIPLIHKEYPNLKLIQTESECGNGSNDWKAAEYTWELIHHYLSNGAAAYVYWNMILDNTGFSNWGWKQNALISVNKQSHKVVFNPEFYIMKHVSNFVLPGAYLLKSTESGDHLAFLNPNGKIVVVVINRDDKEKRLTINYKNRNIELNFKAKSFNTLQFNAF